MNPVHDTKKPEPADEALPWDTGVLPYQALCIGGLAVVALVEAQRGLNMLGQLVPLVGTLGVLSRMSLAPVLLLLTMAATWTMRHFLFLQTEFAWQGMRGADALLCGGVLVYVIAHYRMQALTDSVVPPDPRRRLTERDWLGRRLLAPQARSPRLATRWEVALLVCTLPVWVLVGNIAWLALNRPWNPTQWPVEIARLLLLAWALGSAAVLAAALFGIWRSRQHSPTTAAVILQDVLWQETRGEQRRITRWLSWGRLKRRGENP